MPALRRPRAARPDPPPPLYGRPRRVWYHFEIRPRGAGAAPRSRHALESPRGVEAVWRAPTAWLRLGRQEGLARLRRLQAEDRPGRADPLGRGGRLAARDRERGRG